MKKFIVFVVLIGSSLVSCKSDKSSQMSDKQASTEVLEEVKQLDSISNRLELKTKKIEKATRELDEALNSLDDI